MEEYAKRKSNQEDFLDAKNYYDAVFPKTIGLSLDPVVGGQN